VSTGGLGRLMTDVLHFVCDPVLTASIPVFAFAFFKRNGRSRELTEDQLIVERERMVKEQIERRGIRDERLLAAMRKVERHAFLNKHQWPSAYGDHPLSIGDDQTISQPYIVALMTEALGLTGSERVLEVGTGCGYQTAILAELADEVFSIEILPQLTKRAQSALQSLGYTNIQFRVGDGHEGWYENAPYDAVLVAAAPKEVPDSLLEQIGEEGRLVIPVGVLNQELEVHRRRKGKLSVEQLASVRFVPLV
jgi:protein-L-isoaspartate(D-aspartate) O-methyltransferase